MAKQMSSKLVQVLVPRPPEYRGQRYYCQYECCCRNFDPDSRIVMVRMYEGGEFAFCSKKHARYFAGNLAGVAACELWTYRPQGKNGVYMRTKREEARARRLTKGPRQHRGGRKQ